jgi:hypothetical protein
VVEGEDDASGWRHPVVAVVDDDARSVADAETLETGTQRIRIGQFEHQPLLVVVAGRRYRAQRDMSRSGNVLTRVLGAVPYVKEDEVGVVQVRREP